MDTNMTFQMDPDNKNRVAEVCPQVHTEGVPFPAEYREPVLTKEQMLADAAMMLNDFAEDYRRMSE